MSTVLPHTHTGQKNHEDLLPSMNSTNVRAKAIPLQAGALRISRQSANEGGNIVNPTHRPPLPPGKTPGTHTC
jgi:hypothetical protein